MEVSIDFEFSVIDYPKCRDRYTNLDRREWWINGWIDPDERFLSVGFRVFGFGFDVTIDW